MVGRRLSFVLVGVAVAIRQTINGGAFTFIPTGDKSPNDYGQKLNVVLQTVGM